jgi:F-type H+-transporting ATPase subunit alpha
VIEQIAVLLALTGGLFDSIPLDKMREAQRVLCTASTQMAAEVRERLASNHKLDDADRDAVLKVARGALAPLQKKP